jgi:hypothetical protein
VAAAVAPTYEESMETTTIRVLNVIVKMTVAIVTAIRRLTIANPIRRIILIITTLARLITQEKLTVTTQARQEIRTRCSLTLEVYRSAWENRNLRLINTYRSCTKGLQKTAYLHLGNSKLKYI